MAEEVEQVVDQENTSTGESSSPEQPSYEELQSQMAAIKEQNQKYSTALHTATKRIDKLEKVARAVPEINEKLDDKEQPKQQNRG